MRTATTEVMAQDGAKHNIQFAIHFPVNLSLFKTEKRHWYNMIARCYFPKYRNYRWYGAKGVSVCDRWRNSFADFLADMGPKPGPEYTLSRRGDQGNYEPGNCSWETWDKQHELRCRHRRERRCKGERLPCGRLKVPAYKLAEQAQARLRHRLGSSGHAGETTSVGPTDSFPSTVGAGVNAAISAPRSISRSRNRTFARASTQRSSNSLRCFRLLLASAYFLFRNSLSPSCETCNKYSRGIGVMAGMNSSQGIPVSMGANPSSEPGLQYL